MTLANSPTSDHIKRLEGQIRRQGAALAVVALLPFAILLMGQAGSIPENIQARKFSIVSPDGMECISIQRFDDGAAGIVMVDGSNTMRLVLGVDGSGAPSVKFFDDVGQQTLKIPAEQRAITAKAPVAPTPENQVFHTGGGTKYHVDGCLYLSKSQIPLSLTAAQSKGLGPCSVCKPPN